MLLPGIDATQLTSLAGQPKWYWIILDMFTGGAFSKASVLLRNYALHFSSIVVQLMGIDSLFAKLQVMVKVVEKRLIRLHVG
jgi:preprotein translocase subunit SecY